MVKAKVLVNAYVEVDFDLGDAAGDPMGHVMNKFWREAGPSALLMFHYGGERKGVVYRMHLEDLEEERIEIIDG